MARFNPKVSYLLSKEAIDLFTSKMPNFAMLVDSHDPFDACNVIGPIKMHPHLRLTAVCIKHVKRDCHSIHSVSGGYPRKYPRHTTRNSWRAVSAYYMIWTADERTGRVISWPEYVVNHPKDIPRQMDTLLAALG